MYRISNEKITFLQVIAIAIEANYRNKMPFKYYVTYQEKHTEKPGSIKQRLGQDSHLPFGYCGLTLRPAEDPVVSSSGHVYSREAILEYLLTKMQEIKVATKLYEKQQVGIAQFIH